MSAVNGNNNTYPPGQCTWYADNRYHELTGFYVPWTGNAKDWSANALAFGWTVSANPTAPSIVCLQPGVQGADSLYGHVGVVESVGKSGAFTSSNLNWGSMPSQVATVSFFAGSGVTFLSATPGSGNSGGSALPPIDTSSAVALLSSSSQLVQSIAQKTHVAPDASVTSFLYALDAVLEVQNPFTGAVGNIAKGVISGDPLAFAENILLNVWDDMVAIVLRIFIFILAAFLMFKVLSAFINFGEILKIGVNVAEIAALS